MINNDDDDDDRHEDKHNESENLIAVKELAILTMANHFGDEIKTKIDTRQCRSWRQERRQYR